MRNIKAMVWIGALLILSGIGFSAMAQQTYSIGYAVRAILPENQINPQVTYFDLRVSPEETQTVQVIVKNREAREIQVAVQANTAFTNENGVIEFTQQEARDPSMQVDFSELVTAQETPVTIPAYGERIVEFTITLPKEPFEGTVYGGLMFTMLDQEKEREAASVTIQNIYRYVIGMRLRETETVVKPSFVVEGAEYTSQSPVALTLNLRNIAPAIVRGMLLKVSVYPQEGNEAIMVFEQPNVSVAPNSHMPYKLYLDAGQTLGAGSYRILVETEYEQERWQGETTLIVE